MCTYVVMDLEMCRLSKKLPEYRNRMETIQIGAVLLNDDYRIIDQFNTFVSPEFGELDEYISSLTGITSDDLANAPLFRDALMDFYDWMPKQDCFIVSWSLSDRAQIMKEAELKSISLSEWDEYLTSWIDAQQLFSDKMNHTTRSYSLSEALFAGDIQPEGHMHNGLDDAYNTALLFHKIMTEEHLQVNEYYRGLVSDEVNHLSSSLGDMLKGFSFSHEAA